MLEKFIDNDVMGFERVLRDIEKILLLRIIKSSSRNKISGEYLHDSCRLESQWCYWCQVGPKKMFKTEVLWSNKNIEGMLENFFR